MMSPSKMIVTASLLLFLAACKDKDSNKFEIEGTVKNATASVVYLEEASISNMQPVIVDSARINKNGKFALDAASGEENIYLLRFNDNPNPFATLINDTKDLDITADPTNPKQPYTVKGSPASQQLQDYLTQSNEQLTQIYTTSLQLDSLRQQGLGDTVLTAVEARRQTAVEGFRSYVMQTIDNSKSAPLSVFVLGSYQSYASSPALGLPSLGPQEVQALINKTAARFPKHMGLATLKNSLQSTSQAASPQGSLANQVAPDFTLPDVNGKPVSLSSLKGKYVLVDFWASWCKPCRAENPHVVKAYRQFKDKNFTVLGVSLDKEKSPWLDAIKQDNLTWTHVSDLKFWDSMVVPMYRIEGIPYNVLLDPNGVVIAESLRGDALIAKLAEVLN
jgi:peroxiredoxin